MSGPDVRPSWRSARRALWFAAVGAAAAGTFAMNSATAAAQQPLPGPVPTVAVKVSTAGLGVYDIRIGRPNWNLDWVHAAWLMDGQPLTEHDGKTWFRLTGSELRDGKIHTFTARMQRLDIPGETYDVNAKVRAFKPLQLTAVPQTAATARRRGVAIRISAARGYYRLRAMSARIPAAGGVSFQGPNGGARTIRLRGSYLNRIRPDTRLKVRAQRLYRGHVLETANVAVPFR